MIYEPDDDLKRQIAALEKISSDFNKALKSFAEACNKASESLKNIPNLDNPDKNQKSPTYLEN